MSLQSRTAVATHPWVASIITFGGALAIGRTVAVQPVRAATGAVSAVLIAVAVLLPELLAATAPALILLTPPGQFARLDLLVPVALLVVVIVRKVATRSVSLSKGQGALVAFAVWIVVNYTIHYKGFSESPPTDLSPAADASTLIAGIMLALAASWLDIPRGYLFYLSGGAIAVVAVIIILQGSPETVLFGLNRNYLGMVIALGIAIAVMMMQRRTAVIWLAASVAMAWALVILQSRGATIAAGGGVLLAIIVRMSRDVLGRRTALAAASFAALAAIAVTASPSLSQVAQFGRAQSDLATSDTARFAAVEVALATTALNPVIGVGYGRFGLTADSDPRLNQFINTHNEYLRISAELGLPGIALFMMMLFATLKGLVRSGEHPGLVLFATYLIGLLFANTLSNLLVTALFWLSVGLGLRGLKSPSYVPRPCTGVAEPPRYRRNGEWQTP